MGISNEMFPMKDVFESYGIVPKKALGQNFLNNYGVVCDIVEKSGVTKDDFVIEVGPGLGIMTSILADQAGFVTAVELDTSLLERLRALALEKGNIEIINADIMKLNLKPIIEQKKAEGYKRVCVVANLPYYITTPVIMMFLEQYTHDISSLTFMVQKEVAERLTAKAGGKEYGAITVSVGYFTDAKIVLQVGAHNFVPRPNVDSAVVRMDVYPSAPFQVSDEKFFFDVIRASFCQRRKMLANSIGNASWLGISRETAQNVLCEMGIDVQVRGEKLSPKEFADFANRLYAVKNK